QDSEFSNADQMDLYDDVLAATSQPTESRSVEPPPESRQEPSPKPNNKAPAILYTYSGLRNKRAAVYVGSFSWWTTDQQLIQTIRSIGVYDVVELKFAENRANGQSKGYAEVVVASENSVHKLLELLPGKILNGDKVEVRLATRQNLSQFEAQARKHLHPLWLFLMPLPCAIPGVPPRAHSRDSMDLVDGRATPTENALPPARVEKPPSTPFLSIPVPRYSCLSPCVPPSIPDPLCPSVHPCVTLGIPLPTSPCVPLPFCSSVSLCVPLSIHDLVRPSVHHCLHVSFHPCPCPFLCPCPPVPVPIPAAPQPLLRSSPGDYSDAIETLLTAIAVIKQSRVANDERCRVLLSSLKDCLHGIEAKSYSSGSGSSSSRKRHRSRERSPSRSRESSRRHRDLLHSEDRHEDYFQERNREHERHRDRDRERDR
ncbi:CPSF7 factor, partial [Centropus bengalensis]|nr:CPSF7 factor [Centropus bengalensis]